MAGALRSRITAVVAGGAVLALVSGTTGAVASRLITSDDIKNHTITTQDLRANSIYSKAIANQTVRREDLSAIVFRLLDRRFTGYEVVLNQVVAPANAVTIQTASCDPGDHVLGGGYGDHPDTLEVKAERPSATTDGWQVTLDNASGAAGDISLYAVCATVS